MSEQPSILHDVSFCHLVVCVTDMDRALAFYRDVIGMEIVFEPPRRGIIGIQNVSLSVNDLDDTHRRIATAGYPPDQEPFEIEGVRMFFVKDRDGTPVEFIELPDGARSTYEMHRGVRLQIAPA